MCVADLQRDHEERRALFSCYYWAIYSWNREEMVSGGAPPAVTTWKAALVGSSTHKWQTNMLFAIRLSSWLVIHGAAQNLQRLCATAACALDI